MKKILTYLLVLATILATFAAFPAVASAAAPMAGAVWTTDVNGNPINQNIYQYKIDVYLNGGPKSSGAPGLPDGWYYVKVTAPNGVLLGTSVGSPTPKPVQVVNGRFVQIYMLYDIVYWVPGLGWKGYNDTPNNGNEYKVWVSMDPNFANSASKTDNFKVRNAGCPPETNLTGVVSQNDEQATNGVGQGVGKESAPGQNKEPFGAASGLARGKQK